MRRRHLIALAWCAVAGAACQRKEPSVVKTGTAADSAEQVLYGVRAPITESGVRRGELVADSMYVFNNQTRFHFFHGRIEFNTPTGAPNGTMRGDRGIYEANRQLLEGWGNVVVTNVAGDTLRSPHLVYDQPRDQITSDTTYRMVHQGRVVTGKGLTTDSKFVAYQCRADCTAVGHVNVPR